MFLGKAIFWVKLVKAVKAAESAESVESVESAELENGEWRIGNDLSVNTP